MSTVDYTRYTRIIHCRPCYNVYKVGEIARNSSSATVIQNPHSETIHSISYSLWHNVMRLSCFMLWHCISSLYNEQQHTVAIRGGSRPFPGTMSDAPGPVPPASVGCSLSVAKWTDFFRIFICEISGKHWLSGVQKYSPFGMRLHPVTLY